MSKDREICFQTTAETQMKLESIAEQKGQSLSSLIEFIVSGYLKKAKSDQSDKRQFPRLDASIPVVVQIQFDSNETHYRTGEIVNISMGGVSISLPKHDMINYELVMNSTNLEILFKLPDTQHTITFKCAPKRMSDEQESLNMGVCFVESDLFSQQALHRYML
jgi:hypothetical protein